MTAYLIAYGADLADRFAATAFPTRLDAQRASVSGPYQVGVPAGSHAGGCHYVVETEADARDLGPLVAVYNAVVGAGSAVKKFESRAVGARRLLAALAERAAPAATQPRQESSVTNETQETKDKKPGKMAVGKPASADKFKPGRVRAGTDRHKVLELMTGELTAPEVDQAMSFKPGYSLSHFYCLARDCGVGYAFDDAGRVTALYPEGQGLATVVAAPAAKKAA